MPHYVTEEGLKLLQEELKDIIEVQLPNVVSSIESALKDGDIKENSPLSASREKRDELLVRQGQIEAILNDYELISDKQKDNTIVRIGAVVTIQFTSNNLTQTFRIVGSSEANPSSGLISDESPLGSSLLGKKVDTTVNYKTPSGVLSVKILKIE